MRELYYVYSTREMRQKIPLMEKTCDTKSLTPVFLVYSVGEDGHDDGDKERTPRNKRKNESYTYDITFIIQ